MRYTVLGSQRGLKIEDAIAVAQKVKYKDDEYALIVSPDDSTAYLNFISLTGESQFVSPALAEERIDRIVKNTYSSVISSGKQFLSKHPMGSFIVMNAEGCVEKRYFKN